MPVYVYKNLSTEETFEVTQSIKDDAWKVHPETGDPVKRLIQPVGIAFKGSGFYVNDSKKSSNGTSKKASDTEAAAKSDSKTETKPESKAAPTPEKKTEKKTEKKSASKAASTS